MENNRSSRVPKIDIPSVIDVNKNKTNMLANKKLSNQQFFFKTPCKCYVVTLKCIICIFLTIKIQTFCHLHKFAKQTYTNNIYVISTSLLALSKDFFSAVSAGGSKVIQSSRFC